MPDATLPPGPTPSAARPGEIVSLTSLRGVLAVWVVVYHYWNDVLRLFPWAEPLSPFARIGSIAVPAFFMLSGFVLSYNYAERFRRIRAADAFLFYKLRLARIYPVHFVTLLAVVPMVLVARRSGHPLAEVGYTASGFIRNLFLVHTWVPWVVLDWNYPSWSISSEWFAYLLFPFAAAWLLHRLSTLFRAAAFGLFALASSIAVYVWWTLPFHELADVVPTFLSGASIYWIDKYLPRGGTRAGILSEALALAIVGACFLPPAWVVATVLSLLLALIFTLVRSAQNCLGPWRAKPVVFVGEISYSLYMTHTLVQKLVNVALPSERYQSSSVLTRIGVLAVYAGSIALLAALTYFVVEKPCRSYFKRFTSRSPKTVHSPNAKAVK